MADYSNVGDELDIVNVTFPVGRTSRGGRPAVNMPTDMMLVYFFLYRIFSSYPQTRINAKIAKAICQPPRLVDWGDPTLKKRIGDSVYEYQRLDPDLYVDGRIDRTNETFRTPRNQKVYTIIALQCEYIRINPLKDKTIGEIMLADQHLPDPLKKELFGLG